VLEKRKAETQDYFALKTTEVDLVGKFESVPASHLTIEDLEAMRVGRQTLPASKHGLDAVCGASCDIGAL